MQDHPLNKMSALFDAHGQMICAFVLGHVSPAYIFTPGERAIIASRLSVALEDLPNVARPKQFFIRRSQQKRDCTEWESCPAEAPGAIAVTGYTF